MGKRFDKLPNGSAGYSTFNSDYSMVLLHEWGKERAIAIAIVKLVFNPNGVRLSDLNHAVECRTLKQQFSSLVVELART